MINPMVYADDKILLCHKNDRSYSLIKEGSDRFKLVITCDEDLLRYSSKFALVLRPNSQSTTMDPDTLEDIQKKTDIIMRQVLYEMNDMIMLDPYFDILDRKISDAPKSSYIYQFISKQNLKLMEETKTFKKWRKKQIVRSQLRDAFLSNSVEDGIKYVKKEEAPHAIEFLVRLSNTFKQDQHFCSVLANHIRALSVL